MVEVTRQIALVILEKLECFLVSKVTFDFSEF